MNTVIRLFVVPECLSFSCHWNLSCIAGMGFKNFWLCAFLSLLQCTGSPQLYASVDTSKGFSVDTLTLIDNSRNRRIPVAIYQPRHPKQSNGIPVLFSHGYGANKGDDYYTAYTYLTEFLATQGYFVVSIQHELPTDEPLATTGDLQVARRPNWERGVSNIYFVLQELKEKYPRLDYSALALIGHSNGGDQSALFAHQFPGHVNKLISLDNRRMPLPRCAQPKIFTLRSKDYPADPDVLPAAEEQLRYGIVVTNTAINHGDMDNHADAEQRRYLCEEILEYLKR